MQKIEHLIVPLASPVAEEEALVGLKVAKLASLYRTGFPVPLGFIVTPLAFRYFLKSSKLDKSITAHFEDLILEDSGAIIQASRHIQEQFKQATLPESMIGRIENLYDQLVKEANTTSPSCVLRYSLPRRDSGPNFHLPPIRGIKGKSALARALVKAYSLLYDSHVLANHAQTVRDIITLEPTVLVELQLEADRTGIFTSSVSGQDPNLCIIQAVWGSSELLHESLFNGDTYRISKESGQVLAADIEKQEWKLSWQGMVGKHQKIPRLDQSRQKLLEPELLTIARLAKSLEESLHTAVIGEWLIDTQSRLWLISLLDITEGKAKESDGPSLVLRGRPGVVGLAVGPVRLVRSAKDLGRISEGDILVLETTSLSLKELEIRPAGIVVDSGHPTHELVREAMAQAIPLVVGATQALERLVDGLVVTVDGTRGLVYRGKIEASNANSGSIVTGTKVYIGVDSLDTLLESTIQLSNGIGLMPVSTLLNYHPRAVVENQISKTITDHLTTQLVTIASRLKPKEVFLKLDDETTDHYRCLPHGDTHEETENNPMLGYRGAFRHLREPHLLKLELEALRKARDEHGLGNLHLILPFIRTYEEFTALRQLVTGSGLTPGRGLKLWLLCQTPSMVLLIHKFCSEGQIQGVCIDLDSLTQLTLAIDQANPKFASEYTNLEETVLMSLYHVVSACRAHNLPVTVYGRELTSNPELIEHLVKAGVSGLVVEPEAVTSAKKILASAEQRLLLSHALADLQEEG